MCFQKFGFLILLSSHLTYMLSIGLAMWCDAMPLALVDITVCALMLTVHFIVLIPWNAFLHQVHFLVSLPLLALCLPQHCSFLIFQEQRMKEEKKKTKREEEKANERYRKEENLFEHPQCLKWCPNTCTYYQSHQWVLSLAEATLYAKFSCNLNKRFRCGIEIIIWMRHMSCLLDLPFASWHSVAWAPSFVIEIHAKSTSLSPFNARCQLPALRLFDSSLRILVLFGGAVS